VKRRLAVGFAATILLAVVLAATALSGFFRENPREEGAGEEEIATEAAGDGGRLRVEVLNGARVPGLARSATRVLRQQNFDVVYFGNAAGGARDTSEVIDRVGRPEDARRVAEALGIATVRSAPDTTLYLEATVVLGRDWQAPASVP
jgi:hypothetical protein